MMLRYSCIHLWDDIYEAKGEQGMTLVGMRYRQWNMHITTKKEEGGHGLQGEGKL